MLAALALIMAPATLPTDGWVAFEQPLVDGITRMGCSRDEEVFLSKREDNWTVSDDGGIDQERFTVYANLRDGAPVELRAYTPQCEVMDADRARQLEVSPEAAVEMLAEWLEEDRSRDIDSRLFATLAHIDHADVNAALDERASDLSDEDMAQDALFWLANRRDEAGRYIVARHASPDWPLEHRKDAVMALALSGEETAFETVREFAREDASADLREHSVVALAINHAPGALADLHSIFISDTDEGVREKAIFGLAQLETREAANVLLDIARNPEYGEHRREALFWLANMEGTGGELLEKLISTSAN